MKGRAKLRFATKNLNIDNMGNLNIQITKLKNIDKLSISLPIEKGLFALTGSNGTGKSTIMRVISKIVHSSAYNTFQSQDYNEDTKIVLEYEGKSNVWTRKGNRWNCDTTDSIKITGFYEGSIIHGTRFSDANYEALLKAENVQDDMLVDADNYVKENLSEILHGEKGFYMKLKRMGNRNLAKMKQFKGLPYFIEGENGLINQFCMSTGENMLIGLLHLINSLLINKQPSDELRLILIDEIELALHPSAIMRLLRLLQGLTAKYNLCIYFSSHSVELIRQIEPNNMFYLQKESNGISIINPCRPAYATRDIYQHSGCDVLILVEDILSKMLVKRVIDDNKYYESTLINILPVGGWENILRMHSDVVQSKLAGPGVKIMSILDGDVEEEFNKKYLEKGKYTNLPVGFLPVMSLEKYLHSKLFLNKDVAFFKEINDRFFHVKSLKDVINEMQNPNDNKSFYRCLLSSLNTQGIESNLFEQKVCEIICNTEDLTSITKFFKDNLGKPLNH